MPPDSHLGNTCAVRDHAEAKVRGRLGELAALKRARPGMRIGVMGCMAQRERAELIKRFPHVDLVVGTDQFVHMPQLAGSPSRTSATWSRPPSATSRTGCGPRSAATA